MQIQNNQYSYIDSKNRYTLNNGVLRNIANIEDEKVLLVFESLQVSKRLEELFFHPININDSSALLKIHHHLFQDVYEWAGKIRTVNISKNGKPFFEIERFQMGFKYVDSLIVAYKKINPNLSSILSQKLAEILDNINFMHPFREGNGRTQREFIRTLAFQKGYLLNLNPPNNKSIYNRYMKGTIESDVNILQEIISEELKLADIKY
jgi:cell filamentation protein